MKKFPFLENPPNDFLPEGYGVDICQLNGRYYFRYKGKADDQTYLYHWWASQNAWMDAKHWPKKELE